MNVNSTRFGTLEVKEEDTLYFPEGIPGVETVQEYCLVPHAPDSPFTWLQAVSLPALAFVLIDPFQFYPHYDLTISDADADALDLRGIEDVRVFVIVDWLGSWRSLSMWRPVRDAGAEVRVFNPPRLSSPLGWLSRDHRKTIVVDGEVGFVSGLCLSERWLGNPRKRLEPWRDTGIAIRGPAVASLEQAFLRVFATSGTPLEPGQFASPDALAPVHGKGEVVEEPLAAERLGDAIELNHGRRTRKSPASRACAADTT